MPALTADTSSVAVSITAQEVAPCLTVTPEALDFGTVPYSGADGHTDSRALADITINNCGTAVQNLLAATSDAVGPSGSWAPSALTGPGHPCIDLALNQFFLTFGFFFSGAPDLFLTHTPSPYW
jgi:hypothetical protein